VRKLGLLLVLLAGCTRANPLEIGGDDGGGGGRDGGGGGGDGGGAECAAFGDRASCEADPNCVALGCPQCDGSTSFLGCFDKNGPLPGFGCPADACASCTGLDQATCDATPGCRADFCAACNPGSTYFASCSPAGEPPPTCLPTPCPPPLPCQQLNDVTSCSARSDCHAVYEPAACACVNCCCTVFSQCASGGTANCKGQAFCNIAPPDCSNSACNGDYTVAYANGCYEGCVLTSECAP
jgi:hypothetical protein